MQSTILHLDEPHRERITIIYLSSLPLVVLVQMLISTSAGGEVDG